MIENLFVTPYWDEYFMEMAVEESRESDCRRQVGAVLVKEGLALLVGHNGVPDGLKSCKELGGCIRQRDGIESGKNQEHCRAVHAEQNIIVKSAREGIPIKGGTIYVTDAPCGICTRMLINCEIGRIVYLGDYPDENAKSMLEESGIPVEKLEVKENKALKKER